MSQKIFIAARGLEDDYSATVAKFEVEKAQLQQKIA